MAGFSASASRSMHTSLIILVCLVSMALSARSRDEDRRHLCEDLGVKYVSSNCTEDHCVCRDPSNFVDYISVGNHASDIMKRLSRCTIIEGSLRVTFIYHLVSEANYTNVSLPKLREITGYLFLHRVDGLKSLGQLFPNLRVIRGEDTFYSFGLLLYEMKHIETISLYSLTYLGKGMLAMDNPRLCYVETVDWNRLVADPDTKTKIGGNQDQGACSILEGCPDDCPGNCWDMDHCQIDCRNCDRGGSDLARTNHGCTADGRCCDDQCLGGCTSPNDPRSCYACQHVYYNGTCMASCPKETEDGEPLLEYMGLRCVTRCECLDLDTFHKFSDDGKCISQCPVGWKDHAELLTRTNDYDVHKCVKCESDCENECHGNTTIETVSGSARFQGCTVIDGYLEIAISIKGDVTELEKNLGSIHTITGYFKMSRCHFLTSIHFLKSLRTIRGRHTTDGYALIVMDNENLNMIWDMDNHPNLTLGEGKMRFQQNPYLCYKQITALLAHTTFLGNETVDKATGAVTQSITAATHTVYDISDVNNGQYGNCFNNSLSMNVSVTSIWVKIAFAAFNTSEPRIIINYLVRYRPVGDNETVSYYSSQDLCNDNGSSQWKVKEILPKEDVDVYSETLFSELESYRRYAVYVQTHTTKVVNLDGARSRIHYFRTKPTTPGSPTINYISAVDNKVIDNTGLEISWQPPEQPNGVIQYYFVYFKQRVWKTDLIDRKDFCFKHSVSVIEPEATSTPPVTIETNTTKSCSCPVNGTETKTSPEPNRNNVPSSPGVRRTEKETLWRYQFQNYVQNNLYHKNFNRQRRSIDAVSAEVLFTYANFSDTTPVTNITEPTDTTEALPITTLPPTTTTDGSTDPSKAGVGGMLQVDANTTSIVILDLQPYTDYTIEIIACHAYDNETRRTLCSNPATDNSLTLADPTYDVINSSTVKVDMVKGADGSITALKFSWEVPEKTNGPILSYHIGYDKAESTVGSTDRIQELCVTPKQFNENNHTYLWQFGSDLTIGYKYQFRVRLKSVGSETQLRRQPANWTEPVFIQLGTLPEAVDNIAITVGTTVGVAFLVIFIMSLIVFYCYRKKKPPIPSTTLLDSVNPDYIDTDLVYMPDEWELERSKVRIGEALGQGSFGMVYEGIASDLLHTDRKATQVAIKTVNNTASLQERINFLNEASRMKTFDCHHIVKLLGVVSIGTPVLVIMELMSQGDLRNYLRKHRPDELDNEGRKPPTLKEILHMAAEIADGMAYLADQKFVHRDLAARNCMVSKDMTVKIGDFGMSRDVYYSEYYRKGGKAMLPVRWMAPESLRDGMCTSKSDVWSYGIVLYEMATLAAQPYVGFSNEQVISYVLEGNVMEMPSGCPGKLAELMTRCWQYYPKQRPTFGQILESLQGYVKKSFFGVSWFYTRKDADLQSQESSQSLEEEHTYDPEHLSTHSMDDSDDEVEYVGGNSGFYPPRQPSSGPLSNTNSPKETDALLLNGHAAADSDDDETELDSDSRGADSPPERPPKNITESLPVHIIDYPPNYNTVVPAIKPNNKLDEWSDNDISRFQFNGKT